MSAEAVSSFRFSTAAFPERDRIAGLRDLFGRQILRLELEPLTEPFHADIAAHTFPQLGIAAISHSLMRVNRTRELLGDGEDSLVLQIPGGGGFSSQRNREVTTQPGDAVLASSTDAGTFTCSSAAGTSLLINLSRKELLPLIGDLDAALMRRVPASSPALRLLVDYLDVFARTHASPPVLQHLAVRHIYDLVALALAAVRDPGVARRSVRAARLHAAKAFALRNIAQHGLSAATVATHLGVTPRYVNMLFGDDDETFSEFVLRERLAHAHRLLANPNLSNRAVSSIAFDVGFGDLSYFNRCFRRRFGATPSQVRAMAISESSSLSPPGRHSP